MALTRLAHQLISQHFARLPDTLDLAVDATCGNGHDTAFLARLGFKNVIAIDIQAQAIKSTQTRLNKANLTHVQFYQQSHEQLDSLIESPVDCFMFNLGYLPHGDKDITTMPNSTLAALSFAILNLSKNGFLSLLCYPGHPQGKIETAQVQHWLGAQSNQWNIEQYLSQTTDATSPILYTVTQAN